MNGAEVEIGIEVETSASGDEGVRGAELEEEGC